MNETDAYYQYIDMIRLIAHKLYVKNTLYSIDDLVQIGSISIINSYRKFDPSRNTKMSTLVFISARRDMIGFILKNKNKSKEFELDDQVKKDLIFTEDESFSECIPNMSETDKKIINLIRDGYNKEDISKKMDVSPFKIKRKINSIFKRIEVSNEKESFVSN